jgi:hypothetical protein
VRRACRGDAGWIGGLRVDLGEPDRGDAALRARGMHERFRHDRYEKDLS